MVHDRRELEEMWRQLARVARLRYEGAKEASRAEIAEHVEAHFLPDGAEAILRAHNRERDALNQYVRILRIYTELVFKGRMPDGDVP